MLKSRLKLRRLEMIVTAYFVSPFVATIFLLAEDTFIYERGAIPRVNLENIAALISGLMTFESIGLILELIFATPILFAFERFQWRWLNGWSAALIGLATTCLPLVLMFGGLHSSNFTEWVQFIVFLVPWGAAGALGGLVFRLIAVRTARIDDPPED